MASDAKSKRVALTEEIVELGTLAYNPSISQNERRQHMTDFSALIAK